MKKHRQHAGFLHGEILRILDQLREKVALSPEEALLFDRLERASCRLIARDALATARFALRAGASHLVACDKEATQIANKGTPLLCEVLQRADSAVEREERVAQAIVGILTPILQERDNLRSKIGDLKLDVEFLLGPYRSHNILPSRTKKETPLPMPEKKIDVTPEQVIEAISTMQANLRKKHDSSPIRACDVRSYIFKGDVGAPPTEKHRLQERAVNRALQKARRAGAIEWSTIVHTWRTVA